MKNNFNKIIEEKLAYLEPSKVKEAMLYSILGDSKRIRPILLYLTLEGFNNQLDVDEIAVAIEMVHTYSLIHDDLPAMDDDLLRRGKNACHIEFGEALAILAGDALLTEAFNLLSKSKLDSKILLGVIKTLATAAGANKMILGQELDILSEGKEISLEELKKIHSLKTGALLSAPLMIASLVASREDLYELFGIIGVEVGLAYQIQDDILDVLSNSSILGKSNSDESNDKATSVSILGLEKAKELMEVLYDEAITKIMGIKDFNSKGLVELINTLRVRNK